MAKRDWDYHPPSSPLKARGGIKSQSRQGAFARTWWGARWIEVLEGFRIGARLGRGRSYARKGQVLSIDILPGEIRSRVQGSRAKPYEVVIQLKPIGQRGWSQLAAILSQRAVFVARLLAGEMPDEMEQAFHEAGLSLFPQKINDLETKCTCPDYSNPCKHIAAVYYLVSEEFDRDPFLLLRLRGMERDDLLARLKIPLGAPTRDAREAGPPSVPGPPEPLPPDPEVFWKGPENENDRSGRARIPPVAGSPVKRLGPFPFWRGEEGFLPAMDRMYERMSALGLEMLHGESGEEEE